MALHVYNTLTRQKEEFIPIDPELVRVYVCGPTVYGHAHVGHAKSYVSFDIVRRYLMHRYGPEHLLYVMNITDVGHLVSDADEGEDKVEVQARRENRSPYEIAAEYEESFWADMRRLNVLHPDRTPHATDFIRQQIMMVEKLIERGVAYEANGSVYFDVDAYQRLELDDTAGMIPYGGLSNRKVEDQESGGRIAANPEKRSPNDFALWKRADESHFMQWYSPWGWGFPGWHLECSAMSQFYLGATFDIHGGGVENKFPHHECEVAQSQAATGHPFVHYWMHNNLVTIGGRKMGKSLGNASSLQVLFEQYDPMAVRFFIAQSQYNSQLEFDQTAIASSQTGLEKLRGTMRRLDEAIDGLARNGAGGADAPPFMERFFRAMDDDFNTPVALSAAFEGVAEVNRMLAAGDATPATLRAYRAAFETAFEQILGITVFVSEEASAGAVTGDLVELLIGLRAEARARKDFATSDAIRDRLLGLGIALEDTKEGTRWTLAAPAQ